MVADEFVELLTATVEPAREALVELGAELLGDPLVRGVTDQQVPEAKGVLDHLVRADQLLADESCQLSTRGSPTVGSELTERLPFELEPNDGRTLEQLPLLVGEGIEPRREQRLNRRRHMFRVAPFDQHREQLLDEERIPRCNLADPGMGVGCELGTADELLDQLVRFDFRERLEREGLGLGLPAPVPPDVDQIGPREADEQERGVSRPVHEMLEQVEQGRLGPVDVLDDERDRSLSGAPLERLPDRPEDVLCRYR